MCDDLTGRMKYLPDEGEAFPISTIVAADQVVAINTEDEDIDELFQNSFDKNGRVSHVEQIMAWHPSFLQCFQVSNSFIMTEDGPLSLNRRDFIAMMAVRAQHSVLLTCFADTEPPPQPPPPPPTPQPPPPTPPPPTPWL
jgi:hypothetical protein